MKLGINPGMGGTYTLLRKIPSQVCELLHLMFLCYCASTSIDFMNYKILVRPAEITVNMIL